MKTAFTLAVLSLTVCAWGQMSDDVAQQLLHNKQTIRDQQAKLDAANAAMAKLQDQLQKAQADNAAALASIAKLEDANKELIVSNTKLQADRDQYKAVADAKNDDSEKQKASEKEIRVHGAVAFNIVDKVFDPNAKQVGFVFSLKNNTLMDVRSVRFAYTITDRHGKVFFASPPTDLAQVIPAGEETQNAFQRPYTTLSEPMKVFSEIDLKDVVGHFEIYKVSYANGETDEVRPE